MKGPLVQGLVRVSTIRSLTLCGLFFVNSGAFAAEIIPLQGKYSKLKLDGICSANGGESYGSASSGGYGCSKGKNTVECDHGGNCTGYIGLQVQPGGNDKGGVAGAVLEFSEGK